MKRFTFHADSACVDILDVVDEESDLTRSEFVRRAVKLATLMVHEQGVEVMPPDEATVGDLEEMYQLGPE